jgi:hypothetical protein
MIKSLNKCTRLEEEENTLRRITSPMFKRKCYGTTKIDAWVHGMTLGLINVAHIGMHYAKK